MKKQISIDSSLFMRGHSDGRGLHAGEGDDGRHSMCRSEFRGDSGLGTDPRARTTSGDAFLSGLNCSQGNSLSAKIEAASC
jgi:hypothetical protein